MKFYYIVVLNQVTFTECFELLEHVKGLEMMEEASKVSICYDFLLL